MVQTWNKFCGCDGGTVAATAGGLVGSDASVAGGVVAGTVPSVGVFDTGAPPAGGPAISASKCEGIPCKTSVTDLRV